MGDSLERIIYRTISIASPFREAAHPPVPIGKKLYQPER